MMNVSWKLLKKIAEEILQEAKKEVDSLIMRVFRDKENLGALDLEATEMCVRQTVHCLGATLLQKLVNSDRGDYRGPQIDDGVGAIADFVEYRTKDVTTVLGNITVNRAYYYNATNGNGMIPKDKSLDIEGTGFSPGVRRMMARVGANESFAAGRDDLQELAGITVSAKDIERVAEGIGEHIELIAENNRRNALSESVVPLAPKIQKLYIEMDGTGVPPIKRETEGRKGKAEGGIAKTREAKLGVIFTQTGLDFYCAAKNLVIEIDGDAHSGEKAYQHDIKRTVYLENLGLQVVRYSNADVITNMTTVLEDIITHLNK